MAMAYNGYQSNDFNEPIYINQQYNYEYPNSNGNNMAYMNWYPTTPQYKQPQQSSYHRNINQNYDQYQDYHHSVQPYAETNPNAYAYQQQTAYRAMENSPVQTSRNIFEVTVRKDSPLLRNLLKSKRRPRFDPNYSNSMRNSITYHIDRIPTPPLSPKPLETNNAWTRYGSESTKDKRSRQTYTSDQTLELEKEFNFSQYLSRRRRIEISNTLKLTEYQIKTWFQNRRMKAKKDLIMMSPTSETV